MKDYKAQTIILKDANGNYLIPYTEKQDRLSTAQLSAVDSGITSDKVNTYDNSLAEIAKKQDKLSETQLNVLDSGITSDKVSAYDTHLSNTDVHITQEERTNLSNLGELAYKDKIVGSDITGTLAQGKIAGLTTALDDKQNKLVAGQNITIDPETNTISATGGSDSSTWGSITGTLTNQTDLNTALGKKQATITDLESIRAGAALGATAIQEHQDISGKQDKLTAGANISIENNVVSVTGNLGTRVVFVDWSKN